MRERRIEITPMGPGDLEAVLEIEAHAFRAPHSRRIFEEELARDWAHLDLARVRDADGTTRVVAYCNYWLVRDEVHLLNIATHPDELRRGHARRLLRHLIDFARRRRCRYVTLEVRRSNTAAIDLYRRLGFEAVGVRPKYYVEDNEDAVVMLLEL
jgi:ribosomal-protein-alanine N-acetyltransferase